MRPALFTIAAALIGMAGPSGLLAAEAQPLPPIQLLQTSGTLSLSAAAASPAQTAASPQDLAAGYPILACHRRTERVLAPCTAPRIAPAVAARFGQVEVDCLLSERSVLTECTVVSADFEALKTSDSTRRAIAASGPKLGLNGISRVWVRLVVPLDDELLRAKTAEQAAARASPVIRQNADWISQPNAVQLASVYPSRANEAGVAGTAIVDCKITAAANLVDCFVRQETPRAEGFGEAALALTPFMRLSAPTENARPTDGTISIPINFAPTRPGVLGRLLGN